MAMHDPADDDRLAGKIREIWQRLDEKDISLYRNAPRHFIGRVQEKEGIAREEVIIRMKDLEKACSREARERL